MISIEDYLKKSHREYSRGQTVMVFIDMLNQSGLSRPIPDNQYVYDAVHLYVKAFNKQMRKVPFQEPIDERDFMGFLIKEFHCNGRECDPRIEIIKRNILIHADNAWRVEKQKITEMLVPKMANKTHKKRLKDEFKTINKELKKPFKTGLVPVIKADKKNPYGFDIQISPGTSITRRL